MQIAPTAVANGYNEFAREGTSAAPKGDAREGSIIVDLVITGFEDANEIPDVVEKAVARAAVESSDERLRVILSAMLGQEKSPVVTVKPVLLTPEQQQKMRSLVSILPAEHAPNLSSWSDPIKATLDAYKAEVSQKAHATLKGARHRSDDALSVDLLVWAGKRLREMLSDGERKPISEGTLATFARLVTLCAIEAAQAEMQLDAAVRAIKSGPAEAAKDTGKDSITRHIECEREPQQKPSTEQQGTFHKKELALKARGLRGDPIGDAGILELATTLKTDEAPTVLYQKQSIADALKTNMSHGFLDLSRKGIDDAGAWALAEALKTNDALKTLYLSNNSIGDAGAQALAEALQTNTALTRLDLDNNSIGDAGAQALAEALKTNDALTELWLYNNSIGDAGAQALAEAQRASRAAGRELTIIL